MKQQSGGWKLSKSKKKIKTKHQETAPMFVDVQGVADYLRCSKETIHRLLAADQIPAHRVGKLWRFDITEVGAWVKTGGAAW